SLPDPLRDVDRAGPELRTRVLRAVVDRLTDVADAAGGLGRALHQALACARHSASQRLSAAHHGASDALERAEHAGAGRIDVVGREVRAVEGQAVLVLGAVARDEAAQARGVLA